MRSSTFKILTGVAALLALTACAVPFHDLAGFDRLDLEGFPPLERELAVFADRSADEEFFDSFLSSSTGGLSVPATLTAPAVRSMMRQVLVLRTAGGTMLQGLASLNASATLVQDALKSGGFVALDPAFLKGQVPGVAPTALTRTWYSNGSVIISMAADGLLVFAMPADSLFAMVDESARLASFSRLLERTLFFAARNSGSSGVKASGGTVANASSGLGPLLIRLDLDPGAGGIAGKILGGLILEGLTLEVHGSKTGVDMTWMLKAPLGGGTGLLKKAVRLWFWTSANRLGLPADFLQNIDFIADGDVLRVSGVHMSKKAGLEFMALMGSMTGA